MTGPKGNSEFCFPEILNVSRGEAERNIEGRGETKLIVSRGASHQCFVIPPDSKIEKTCEKMICTSDSQAELSYWNDTITVFFFAANKSKDNT